MSEIKELVDFIRANPFPEDLDEARSAIDALGTPVSSDISTEKLDIDGLDCLWFTPPDSDDSRAVLYLHGGGYAFGSLVSYAGLASEIARAAKCPVLLPDYRRAPEYSFPAPIDDAAKAYSFLLEKGLKSGQIGFCGDSAGGGLVISAMLSLKQSGKSLPGAGVCISPWVDMKCEGESMSARLEKEPMLQREGLMGLAELYMNGQDMNQTLAAPLNADLGGLPPLLIQVGECEILFSDAERLAEKTRAQGVEVQLDEWPEMIHVWHLFHTKLQQGRRAIQSIGDYLIKTTSA